MFAAEARLGPVLLGLSWAAGTAEFVGGGSAGSCESESSAVCRSWSVCCASREVSASLNTSAIFRRPSSLGSSVRRPWLICGFDISNESTEREAETHPAINKTTMASKTAGPRKFWRWAASRTGAVG